RTRPLALGLKQCLSTAADLNEAMIPSTKTVLVLFFFLIALLVLLFVLYKKLNRETHGEYTVPAVLTLEAHLGFQLWPRSEEDVEQPEEGEDSQASDGEGEDDGEKPEDDSTDPSNTSNGSDDENSSEEDLEAGEHGRQMGAADLMNETSENKEEKVEAEIKGERGEGTELLIDLKQFSGSAIWSEEEGGGGKGEDLTAL
uniref:Si:ch211-119e14.1 n=1 Tax=Oryzias latipes TaxID=8090 RepID=A0A3P9KNM1_ORYLA